MKKYKDFIPCSEEEFLCFVLSGNRSVESIINRPNRTTEADRMYSTEALATWTVENWHWAVIGAMTCSRYINVLYTYSRILNAEGEDDKNIIAHFPKKFPIYNFYTEMQNHNDICFSTHNTLY